MEGYYRRCPSNTRQYPLCLDSYKNAWEQFDPDKDMKTEGPEDEEEDSDQEDDEAMDQEDTTTTTVPSTPTGLIPTIDQLFKRSFSQELAELANSSSNSNHHQLCEDMLRASPADQQLVMLEDIQQILRDEANFQLCV